MTILTDSIQKLQAIQQHFLASQETTKQLEGIQEGDPLLVPLCDGVTVVCRSICAVSFIIVHGLYSCWLEEKLWRWTEIWSKLVQGTS